MRTATHLKVHRCPSPVNPRPVGRAYSVMSWRATDALDKIAHQDTFTFQERSNDAPRKWKSFAGDDDRGNRLVRELHLGR